MTEIINFIHSAVKNGFRGYLQINFDGTGKMTFNKFQANLKSEELISA